MTLVDGVEILRTNKLLLHFWHSMVVHEILKDFLKSLIYVSFHIKSTEMAMKI